MSRLPLIPLVLAALALGGCGPSPDASQARPEGSATIDQPLPPPVPRSNDEATQRQREQDAEAVMQSLEPRLEAWRALPPDEREEQGRAFGAEFEKTLAQVGGTSLENKVLLYLADWRMHYQSGNGALACLDRIEGSESFKLKNLARRLRVEYLVQVGDLHQARVVAEPLVQQIPEFSPLLALIALHERVGAPPPRTSGSNITGGPDDPATRPSAYLLYCLVDDLNTENSYWFRRYLAEVARPVYAGKVRVVLVTSGSTPLAVAAAVRGLPGAELVDVLWVSPGSDGQRKAWWDAWALADNQRAAVVLGPGPRRLILAVPTYPESLRVLLPQQ